MNARFFITALGVLFLSACAVGPQIETFPPAEHPAGVDTTVRLSYQLGNIGRSGKLLGELLDVSSDGLVLLLHEPLNVDGADGTRLVRLPFGMMQYLSFDQMGSHKLRSLGSVTDKARLERLRLVSRFPQGLSPELERELLDQLGQVETWIPTISE